MESRDFLAICTSLYSTSLDAKKLLPSCSNPRPGASAGKDQPTRLRLPRLQPGMGADGSRSPTNW